MGGTDSTVIVVGLGDGDHVGVEVHKLHGVFNNTVDIWGREVMTGVKERTR
jgi:hypothetical protein